MILTSDFLARKRKWLVSLGALVVVLLVAGMALRAAVPHAHELSRDVETKLTRALGVPVKVGAVRWQLLPLPAVTITAVKTSQPSPVTVKRITLFPNVSMLWQRRLSFNLAEIEGAVVPQLSLRALGSEAGAEALSIGAAGQVSTTDIPLQRLVFTNATWINRRGLAVVYDGAVDFDTAWRPRTAQLSRPDTEPVTEAALARVGQEDRWRVNIRLGGGTANGDVQLTSTKDGLLRLNGQLKPQAVEVASALSAFNRRPAIAGKASGDTTLSASGSNWAAVVQSLQTQSVFNMAPATVLRFDLNKAVRSAGKDHAGQTYLDTLSGSMATQNTPEGMVVNFKNIKARSGALTATGDATLANRRIQAEVAVDLVDGLVGVPLTVSGPIGKIDVTVSKVAVAGAVVGTAVLPGIGTAVGARVGAAIGKLFGPATATPAPPTRNNTP